HELVGAPTAVIEPGAGVGAFALAANRRWPKATVLAVDVNVVTLGLLSAMAPLETRRRLCPVLGDYLRWIGGDAPKPIGSPRLFLGNPPYTRRQDLLAPIAASGLVDSGMASLSAHFLAASFSALRAEDAICFVLPGSWLETRYGNK